MKHNKKKIIGITGGIASGKSSFSNILKNKGYRVIDADMISRSLLVKDGEVYFDLIHEFGSEILEDDKNINRKALSELIFKEKKYRDKLEEILHPPIFREINRLIERYSKVEDIIFVDIPLLYEKYDKLLQYNIYLDEIWLVYVDRDIQIERLIKRDVISREAAIRKIDAQIPIEKKEKMADRIIYNTGNLDNLKTITGEILKDLD